MSLHIQVAYYHGCKIEAVKEWVAGKLRTLRYELWDDSDAQTTHSFKTLAAAKEWCDLAVYGRTAEECVA